MIHLQRKKIFIYIHRPCRLGHALLVFCTAKTSRVIRAHTVLQGFFVFSTVGYWISMHFFQIFMLYLTIQNRLYGPEALI